MANLNELKNRINLLDYIKSNGNERVERVGTNEYRVNPCPICGGKDHFTVYTESNSYSSFSSCCRGGTIIDYLMEVAGLSQDEAIKKLYSLTGETFEKFTQKKENMIQKVTQKKEEKTISRERVEAITQAINSRKIEKVVRAVAPRGIGEDLVKKYNMYVAVDPYEKEDTIYRLYIPIYEEGKIVGQVGRAIGINSDKAKARYKNEAGTSSFFNCDYLKQEPIGNTLLYICEGVFDMLSIEQVGNKAISLNSTKNAEKLIEKIKENLNTASKYHYIICFDNDSAGEEGTEKLSKAFDNIPNVTYDVLKIPEKYNDINEYFIACRENQEEFKQAIKVDSFADDVLSNYIDNHFLNDIKAMHIYKDQTTGFKKLDNYLNGVKPGLYVLGAVSSLGKTTFIHQMADQIAEKGEKVIFFSLEQSKFELTSKSISRQTYLIDRDYATSKTINQIMYTYNIGKEGNEKELEAIKKYKKIAQNMIIVEGNFDVGVAYIRKYVEKYIKLTGIKPIVIVDYLQILRAYNDKMTEKQQTDFNVSELKRISRDNSIPIFAISSFNRDNYYSLVSFQSFKESGAIEYGADVVLALQYSRMASIIDSNSSNSGVKTSKVREAIEEEKAKSVRAVELVNLKNRNGKSGFKIQYDYVTPYNTYVEIETE